MRHFSEVYRHLRRKNWRQYALLAGCTFFRSPHHSLRLYDALSHRPYHPAGGGTLKAGNDGLCSGRFGLRGFTTYASGLFFRQKSRKLAPFWP